MSKENIQKNKRKKIGGIPENIKSGIIKTSQIVKQYSRNTNVNFRNIIIPIDEIIYDSENPRELCINPQDVMRGFIHNDDLQYDIKTKELESIIHLGNTIKNNKAGLINPVIVYEKDQKFFLVAGERRTLACTYLKIKEIEARAFKYKPSISDLKVIQWIENNARQALSLNEKIENIFSIVTESQKKKLTKINTTSLVDNLGISKTQASGYLAVFNGPEDVKLAIRANKITSLKKAVLVSREVDQVVREKMIKACEKGCDIEAIKKIISKKKCIKEQNSDTPFRINMGITENLSVVREILHSVINANDRSIFKNIPNLNTLHSCESYTKAFRSLVQSLEVKHSKQIID